MSTSMREALEKAMAFLTSEYSDARSAALDGDPLSKEARPIRDAIVAALSSPAPDRLSEGPVAWLRDLQPDAEDEALAVCNRIDPGAFAVYTSPRLDREKVKALIQWVEETLLDPFDWIGTGSIKSAGAEERAARKKWGELIDAIMRETR